MKRKEANKIIESVNKTLHPDAGMIFIDEYSIAPLYMWKVIEALKCQK